jgi:hypothetical protein
VQKLTVYGLPLNPMPALDQLKGSSFCVSYFHRQRLGKQLDQAIGLVGDGQILLVDNGAFSAHNEGIKVMDDPAYLDGFEAWAKDILARCPQAIAVLPDVIGGTEEQNAALVEEWACVFDNDCERCMPIWHMHESLDYLLYLCEGFGYIGIGSSGQYWKPGTPDWHARMREAIAAIDAWVADSEGAYVRPRIHLMRAQNFAHLYPVDSSDSTNVARNHGRQLRKSGETIPQFAARVDAKLQASAGSEAEHQAKRPLLAHQDMAAWRLDCAIRDRQHALLTMPAWADDEPGQLAQAA